MFMGLFQPIHLLMLTILLVVFQAFAILPDMPFFVA